MSGGLWWLDVGVSKLGQICTRGPWSESWIYVGDMELAYCVVGDNTNRK